MADETSQKEPSMEEILASIRRIISEDGDEKEKPEAAQAEAVAKSTPAASVAPVEAPAPAGAMTVLLPLALSKIGVPVPPEAAVLVALYTAAIALLMVSRLPTWSDKRLGQRIPTDSVMPFLVMAVLMIALLISYPFSVLAIGGIFYLGHLPFAWRAWRKRDAAETKKETTTDNNSAREPEDD